MGDMNVQLRLDTLKSVVDDLKTVTAVLKSLYDLAKKSDEDTVSLQGETYTRVWALLDTVVNIVERGEDEQNDVYEVDLPFTFTVTTDETFDFPMTLGDE